MKPRPIDECLLASLKLVATSRSNLAQLRSSVDTCRGRIEITGDMIAASQALLAKFDGNAAGAMNGVETEPDVLLDPEQASDGSPAAG